MVNIEETTPIKENGYDADSHVEKDHVKYSEFPRERLREANLCGTCFPIFYYILLYKSL